MDFEVYWGIHISRVFWGGYRGEGSVGYRLPEMDFEVF